MTSYPFNFGPAGADEEIVFGAQRPGYPSESAVNMDRVQEWVTFMQAQGIKRLCCLLSQKQLNYYSGDLLDAYRSAFGAGNVCWAPIEDFHLVNPDMLHQTILPFLAEADAHRERVVVHCSFGSGRTGHVLAAWLVSGRHLPVAEALAQVEATGRNPYEASGRDDRGKAALWDLLKHCEPVSTAYGLRSVMSSLED